MVNHTDNLHSRLWGRSGPHSSPPRVVTPAAQAVRLPLAATIACNVEMKVDSFVLNAIRRQVCRGRRRHYLVTRWHCFSLTTLRETVTNFDSFLFDVKRIFQSRWSISFVNCRDWTDSKHFFQLYIAICIIWQTHVFLHTNVRSAEAAAAADTKIISNFYRASSTVCTPRHTGSRRRKRTHVCWGWEQVGVHAYAHLRPAEVVHGKERIAWAFVAAIGDWDKGPSMFFLPLEKISFRRYSYRPFCSSHQ